jgi:hypothetical protein
LEDFEVSLQLRDVGFDGCEFILCIFEFALLLSELFAFFLHHGHQRRDHLLSAPELPHAGHPVDHVRSGALERSQHFNVEPFFLVQVILG